MTVLSPEPTEEGGLSGLSQHGSQQGMAGERFARVFFENGLSLMLNSAIHSYMKLVNGTKGRSIRSWVRKNLQTQKLN